MRTDDGRHYFTAKAIGKRLGIDYEVLHGLVRSGNVRGIVTTNHNGHKITLIHPDEWHRLRDLVKGTRP